MVKASPEDAVTLAKARQTVWNETYRGIYPDEMIDGYDTDRYALRDRERIEDPAHHYYLFMKGSDCVGYFSFGPYNYGTYKDFTLCLNNLYICDGCKGLGLGKLAFFVIREFCAEQGIDKFFCGCNANNQPAVGFYRHMGGIQGDEADQNLSKADQIIHFEFHLGA